MRNLARARSYVRLADRLESVYAVRVLLPDLHNFAERAFPNDLQQIELFDREPLVTKRLEVNLEVERARARSSVVPLV